MPNLAYSDAVWDTAYRRIFFIPRIRRRVLELKRFLSKTRIQAEITGDVDGDLVSVGTPTGLNPGVNCTKDCKVWIRVTGAGPYAVDAYKAAGGGGGNKVATIASLAAGATGTLTQANSSGLSFPVTLKNPVTVHNDDQIQVYFSPDVLAQLGVIFDGTDVDDEYSRTAIKAALTSAVAKLGEIEDALDTAIRKMFLTDPPDNPQAFLNRFLTSKETELIRETVNNPDTAGNLTRTRSGIFERLRQCMKDELTGSTQDVIKRVVAAAAGVPSGDNQGQFQIASHTPLEQCRAARYRFTCTDDTIGKARFRLDITPMDGSTENVETITAGPFIKRAYLGPHGFGGTAGIKIMPIFTKTGDGSNLYLASLASGWSVDGETKDNTSDGTLWWEITGSGPYVYSFYKSSSFNTDTLVAQATGVTAGGFLNATPYGASGITIIGTAGSAPAAFATGTFLLNPPRIKNTLAGTADYIEVDVTVTSTGIISDLFSLFFFDSPAGGARLNTDVSGSESVSDDYMKLAFPRYAVRDV